MSEYNQNSERLDPIAERVGLDIFTDREREMDALMDWADRVARKFGRSQGLVSHRRHGKTAIMERFYNRLFWERTDVMPFYFELHDGIHKIWMKTLAEQYLYSFLQQYLAYRTQDALLTFSARQSFEHLYEVAEEHNEPVVIAWIDWWEKDESLSDTIKIDRVLQSLPHDFAVETGLNIIVMFDEFQRPCLTNSNGSIRFSTTTRHVLATVNIIQIPSRRRQNHRVRLCWLPVHR